MINPYRHVELVDILLNFKGTMGLEKCKLLVLTLKYGDMAWFKGLRNKSLSLLGELHKWFSNDFTTLRRYNESVENLGLIR